MLLLFCFLTLKMRRYICLDKKEIIIMRIIVRCSKFFFFYCWCFVSSCGLQVKNIHFQVFYSLFCCPPVAKNIISCRIRLQIFQEMSASSKNGSSPIHAFLHVFRRERRSPRRAATTTSTATASAATPATLRASSARGRRS